MSMVALGGMLAVAAAGGVFLVGRRVKATK